MHIYVWTSLVVDGFAWTYFVTYIEICWYLNYVSSAFGIHVCPSSQPVSMLTASETAIHHGHTCSISVLIAEGHHGIEQTWPTNTTTILMVTMFFVFSKKRHTSSDNFSNPSVFLRHVIPMFRTCVDACGSLECWCMFVCFASDSKFRYWAPVAINYNVVALVELYFNSKFHI